MYWSTESCVPNGKCEQSKVNQIYQFHVNHLSTTRNYLPPGSGDFPAFTPTKAGTRFSDPEGMQGWWWLHPRGPRGSAVERQSLASVLSPSCAQPVADG